MFDKINWGQILAEVKTPIGFLGLTVLVAGALAGIGIVWNWPWVVASMIILLFGLVLLVGFITFYRPTHWYQQLQDISDFINSTAFKDYIEDVLEKRLNRVLEDKRKQGED